MSTTPDDTSTHEEVLNVPIKITDVREALRAALLGTPFRDQRGTPMASAARAVANGSRGRLEDALVSIVDRMMGDPAWMADLEKGTRAAFLTAIQDKIASGVRGIKRADLERLSRRLLGWQESLSSPPAPSPAPAPVQRALLPPAEAEPGDAVALLAMQAERLQRAAADLHLLARQAQRQQDPGPLPAYRLRFYRERASDVLFSDADRPRYKMLHRTQVRGPGGCWSIGVMVQAPNGHCYAMTDEELEQKFERLPGPSEIEYWICRAQPYRFPDESGKPPPPLRYVVHAWGVECLTAAGFCEGVIYALEDDPEGLMVAPIAVFERTYVRIDGESNEQ